MASLELIAACSAVSSARRLELLAETGRASIEDDARVPIFAEAAQPVDPRRFRRFKRRHIEITGPTDKKMSSTRSTRRGCLHGGL
jgi:hypothetical protein